MKAIFFDVGNTLLFPYPSVEEVAREVLIKHKIEVDLSRLKDTLPKVNDYYEEIYWRDDSFWKTEEGASGVWTDMYRYWMELVGIDGDSCYFGKLIYQEFGKPERWRPFSDVIPALNKMRKRGLKLGVISNWDSRLKHIFQGLKLDKYFKFIFASAAVGIAKPDPKIFELGLEKVGSLPEETLHVGDHWYADVEGAEKVGLKPILINRWGKFNEANCPTCPKISTLEELFVYL